MKKLILVLSSLALPMVAFTAQGDVFDNGLQRLPSASDTIAAGGANGIFDFLGTIADWLLSLLLVLAVIMILVAAFKYLFAGGDDEKIKSAHKMLIYAAVSIAVALLAQAVIFIVTSIVAPGF